jgi:hypothetical protein
MINNGDLVVLKATGEIFEVQAWIDSAVYSGQIYVEIRYPSGVYDAFYYPRELDIIFTK